MFHYIMTNLKPHTMIKPVKNTDILAQQSCGFQYAGGAPYIMGVRYNRESIFCYDILTSGPKYHLCKNLNLTPALKSSHFVQMVAGHNKT